MVITCLKCPKCKKVAHLKISKLTGDFWCKRCQKVAFTADQSLYVRDKIEWIKRRNKTKSWL